ncbi:MAG: LysE family transporter [Rhodospirillales bacterium]
MFGKAVFAGFVVAVPVGAVGALCLRRAFEGRWLMALIGGIGAAAADGALAAAAMLGLSLVTHVLIDHPAPVRLIGGLLLVSLGVQMIRRRRLSIVQAPPPLGVELRRWWKMTRVLSTGFLLTIVNPATFFAFIGVFAGVGLFGTQPLDTWSSGLIVVGVFVGSALWWATLTALASAVRHHTPVAIIEVVNVALGLIVLGIGVAALISFVRLVV